MPLFLRHLCGDVKESNDLRKELEDKKGRERYF
jgi:hypothetical protein